MLAAILGSTMGVLSRSAVAVSGFPETVLPEQGVSEDDELAHDGRDGDLGRFAGVFQVSVGLSMSGWIGSRRVRACRACGGPGFGLRR